VRFVQDEVALDRDVVITARGAEDRPLDQVVGHAGAGGEPGTLALTVVPDLGADGAVAPQSVVFVIDTSGSMDGASIVEARAALRLCLRHLREGDRFNVIAFADRHDVLAPAPLPFTQRTLEQADRWVEALRAHGGTEMLAPLLEAVRLAPDGVVVLLTDGQVGNEDQILADVLAARGTTRVHTFGIGTNVSDALLGDLARRTGGAMEQIHPGERIDEKVVAQFARALAPRVTEVTLSFEGIEVGELAPGELPRDRRRRAVDRAGSHRSGAPRQGRAARQARRQAVPPGGAHRPGVFRRPPDADHLLGGAAGARSRGARGDRPSRRPHEGAHRRAGRQARPRLALHVVSWWWSSVRGTEGRIRFLNRDSSR
jgi:hypothetical protein